MVSSGLWQLAFWLFCHATLHMDGSTEPDDEQIADRQRRHRLRTLNENRDDQDVRPRAS
jgi:hypothetical protein